MMLRWKVLIYLPIISLITTLTQFGQCQDLEFSPQDYTVQLITSVTTIPGSNVTRIGFNRVLIDDERDSLQLFGLSSSLLTINKSSLDVTVSAAITEGFTVTVAITSGILHTAKLIITVVDPVNDVCKNQAAGQCSQLCTVSEASVDGYTCSCLEGYSLLRNGRTCAVNDPTPIILVSHDNRISEIDTSIQQSSALYQQTNNNNITLFDYSYNDQFVYFVSDSNSRIIQVSLTGSNSSNIVSIATNSITGIAVDWISNNVLYIDSILGTIQQYHVISGYVTPLVTNLVSPKVLAVIPDEPYGYVFWFEENNSNNGYSIKRTTLNTTSNILTLSFNLVNPVAMTIDVVTETLYWIDNNTVSSSSLNGSNKQDIYTSSNNIDSIAVFEDYLYVSSSTSNEVTRVHKRDTTLVDSVYILQFDGIQQLRILHPLAQPITSEGDINECLINNGGCGQGCSNTIGSYYCSCIYGYDLLQDGQTCIDPNDCSPVNIGCSQGCGLNGSNNQTICLCNPGFILDASDSITCIDINECLNGQDGCSSNCTNTDGGYDCSCPSEHFIGPDGQTCIGCSINNGGCSQTCVTSTDSFKCECYTGYSPGADMTSCFPTQAASLITSVTIASQEFVGNSIIEITTYGTYLDTLVYTSNTVSGVNIPSTGNITGMDVDVARDRLYFGDRINTGLFRVQLSGLSSSGDSRTLICNDVTIWGVAYDWINDYVYWTEDTTGMIQRVLASDDDCSTREIMFQNLDSPKAIVIEPFAGYIYWTESGTTSRVRRASMTNPSSIEDIYIYTTAGDPTGIAIDYLSNVLIWSNLADNTIRSSNFNGTNVIDIITTTSDQAPFQIVVTGDKLFWTPPDSAGLNRITLLDSNTLVSFSLEGYQVASSTNGITVIDENKRPDPCFPNPCPMNAPCTANGTEIICDPGGTGNNPCDSNPCLNGGSCSDGGICTCLSGYNGTICDIDVNECDPNPCSNSGICTQPAIGQFSCECATGYNGTTCDIDVNECDPNPCSNSGICTQPAIGQFSCECATGYNGTTCDIDVNECDPNPCSNNGICTQPAIGQFSCECATGYNGTTCDIDVNECDPNPCSNSGICTQPAIGQFSCECATGYNGTTCDIDVNECDPNPCSNNGICTQPAIGQFSCECATGYNGTTCDIDVNECDPNPCSNSGICTQPAIGQFSCECATGYNGTTCDIDVNECDPNPCSNNGICTQPAIGQFSCECASGYNGTTCDIDVNECDPNPCSNSGICTQPAIGQFSCECATGYNGTTCDIDVNECDPNPCSNSGICTQPAIGQFSCECATGYNGTTCDIDVNECDPNPCSNNGICTQPAIGQFSCECATGYNGTTCDIDVNECDPNPCSNNGICTQPAIGQFSCECATGYNGTTCDIDVNECDPNPCSNNGICTQPAIGQFSCECATGYNGTTCDIDVNECDPNPCSNNGICTQPAIGQFSCECATGYNGTTCDIDVNECDPNPCSNNGICTQPAIGQFSCECATGYNGTTCDIDINECDPNPCSNSGTCTQPVVGEFSCECASGYTGPTCDIDINECDPNPCSNSGICTQPVVGEFSCVCATGYTGPTCRDDVNECIEQSDLCQNGGTCDNLSPPAGFLCRCQNGYEGRNCENECPQGTFGANCIEICNCQNGAQCDHVTGVCICEGYTGARCETPLCEQNCNNGGTCSAPNTCSCLDSYTGDTCDERECTNTYCNIPDRGQQCSFDFFGNLRCTCLSGFTGAQCDVTISGQFGSEEKGGVSAGIITGIVLLILIVIAVIIIWKVAIPYYRKKNRDQAAMSYLDTTMVRGNPSVVDDLLDSEYVGREFKNRGLTAPMDNPLYDYIPPHVKTVSITLEESQTSHLSMNEDSDENEWEGVNDDIPFRTDIIPNAVIVNRNVSPDSDFAESDSLDGGDKQETTFNQWKTTDKRGNGTGPSDMV